MSKNMMWNDLPVSQLDTWMIHRTLLSYGLSTSRFPKNTLLASAGSADRRLAFIDSESYGTTFAAESFSKSARATREALLKKRLPVAQGAVFRSSYPKSAEKYASRLGYPIMVRPANGARREKLSTRVYGSTELLRAMSRIQDQAVSRRALAERTHSVLIEKLPEEGVFSFLVIDTEVTSVIRIVADSAGNQVRTGLDPEQVHPYFRSLAVEALRAIPGLVHGAVEICAEDVAISPVGQGVAVTHIEASPSFFLYEEGHAGEKNIYDQLVEYWAHKEGVKLSSKKYLMSVNMRFEGVTEGRKFLPELLAAAADLRLHVRSDEILRNDAACSIELAGDVDAIARLSLQALTGTENGHKAHVVDTDTPKSYRNEAANEGVERSIPQGADTNGVKLAAKQPTRSESSSFVYRVLFLGDFHYGENYSKGGAQIVSSRGYGAGTEALRRFIQSVDYTVANLETPLIDDDAVSELVGLKSYLHRGAPDSVAHELRSLGVDAVGLANNHVMDYGVDGLKSTLDALKKESIVSFGAGMSVCEAYRPLSVPLPNSVGGGELVIGAGFQESKTHRQKFHSYASNERPGCASLSRESVSSIFPAEKRSAELRVAFPHWGSNYNWRNKNQDDLADALLVDGAADIIIGHGAHCLQEVECHRNRWIVHGIGNSHYLAQGRYDRFSKENGILPFSFWAVLSVRLAGNKRFVDINLYPVYSNNKLSNYSSHPVDQIHFNEIIDELKNRSKKLSEYIDRRDALGEDELGYFLRLGVVEE